MKQFHVCFSKGDLAENEQKLVAAGFSRHAEGLKAPEFRKERFHWCVYREPHALVGAATADLLWDWVYIDELWTDESVRGQGVGRQLLEAVESFAVERRLAGVWLWTQSWQAEAFYRAAGYAEFTRFPDFPRGHTRIGFRKMVSSS